MKQKTLSLLLNKHVITFVVTLIIIALIPNYFKKYNLELKDQSTHQGERVTYFFDLDNDGWSEEINAYENASAPAIYINSKDNILIDQWNFRNKFLSDKLHVFCTDANENNFKELYVLTQVKDSIFLNIVEPFGDDPFQKNDIFIDVISEYHGSYDVYFFHVINYYNTSRVEKDKSFVFSINTGFLGDVRRVYKYDLKTQKITKSPHLTNNSNISEIVDLDNDGKNEYILHAASYCNDIDSVYTQRSDYSSWFTVLDDDLSFYFKPIEFNTPYSSVQAFSIQSENESQFIVFNKKTDYNVPSKLIHISNKGEILKSVEITINNRINGILRYRSEDFVHADYKNGLVNFYNNQLEKQKTFEIGSSTSIYFNDINLDGNFELLQIKSADGILNIFNEDFTESHSIALAEKGKDINYGLRLRGNNLPLFYVSTGYKILFYEYSKNYFFYLKYIIYLGIYLAVLLILFLVIKGYKINEEKKKQIEQQISHLQLQTIKNKVDPHFVFNAINTISEMTLMDNKIEADRFISRFSGFMRETLNHSDKIVTTLKEELEYTENFIKLQQIRYNYSFDYKIKISENIDLSIEVPKHVLFCYVENAIKHGLASKKDGHLLIEAYYLKKNLILAVEDNGDGNIGSKNLKDNSTGNGLKIMDQIFDLFKKLSHKKISYKTSNVLDENKNSAGLRVEITITKKKD